MKRRDAEKRRGVSEKKSGVASGEIEEMRQSQHEYYRGELFAMVRGTPLAKSRMSFEVALLASIPTRSVSEG
jgi:hypothetical protein